MSREHDAEVLVVGAGPVGLFTALVLADRGIRVEIIDAEWRAAAQSYACALHPRTLRLMDRHGLRNEVMEMGRRIESVGFYEGATCRGRIGFSEFDVEYPYLLVLPQSGFEGLLENHLSKREHVRVLWNHRLTDLDVGRALPRATIERLAETAKGYVVPSFEWSVAKELHTDVGWVVGTDGHDSLVRRLMGVDYENVGKPDVFAVFECESSGEVPDEARIFRSGATVNGFWPLLGNRCRWSFQIPDAHLQDDRHPKERMSMIIERPGEVDDLRSCLLGLITERAPWFDGVISAIDWSVDVGFERRVARQYGKGRCWLLGDSAHQTCPLGMQSMNEGLFEADLFGDLIERVMRRNASPHILEEFGVERRNTWHRLLGMTATVRPSRDRKGWTGAGADWLLSCVPASGDELEPALAQLGFVLVDSAVCA